VAGIVTTLVGGRFLAPVILAGAETAFDSSWWSRWLVRAVLPDLLVAAVSIASGWAAARWSRGRVHLGVASYAAVAVATDLPQLWGQAVNGWSDARFQPALFKSLEHLGMVLVSLAIGGWLYGRDGSNPTVNRVTPEADDPAKG
jgi:hypothetical protein